MHYKKDMLYIGQLDKGEPIYHYTTMDALLGIVKKKQFWATKYDYMNDIDEFRIAISVLEEVLKLERVEQSVFRDVKGEFWDDMRSDIKDDYYVISFATERDSQLLWSYYSEYDGVNIQIDHEALYDTFKSCLKWCGLVIYDSAEQRECMRKTLCEEFLGKEEYGNMKSLSEISTLIGDNYKMVIDNMAVICEAYSMFFKNSCYCNEKEYRYIFSLANSSYKFDFRSRKSMLVPYAIIEYEGCDFITGATIGPTNKMDISERSIREFLRCNGCEVNVEKSSIPLRY